MSHVKFMRTLAIDLKAEGRTETAADILKLCNMVQESGPVIKELTAEIAHYIVTNQHSALCNLYKMPMDKELRYVESVQESFNAHHDAIETMLTEALQGAE